MYTECVHHICNINVTELWGEALNKELEQGPRLNTQVGFCVQQVLAFFIHFKQFAKGELTHSPVGAFIYDVHTEG